MRKFSIVKSKDWKSKDRVERWYLAKLSFIESRVKITIIYEIADGSSYAIHVYQFA